MAGANTDELIVASKLSILWASLFTGAIALTVVNSGCGSGDIPFTTGATGTTTGAGGAS